MAADRRIDSWGQRCSAVPVAFLGNAPSPANGRWLRVIAGQTPARARRHLLRSWACWPLGANGTIPMTKPERDYPYRCGIAAHDAPLLLYSRVLPFVPEAQREMEWSIRGRHRSGGCDEQSSNFYLWTAAVLALGGTSRQNGSPPWVAVRSQAGATRAIAAAASYWPGARARRPPQIYHTLKRPRQPQLQAMLRNAHDARSHVGLDTYGA